MNTQLVFSLMGLFFCSSLYSAMESPGHSKPAQAAAVQEPEQTSTLFIEKPDVQPWHYGKEVTRLEAMVAKAMMIVKANKDSQDVYQAAMEKRQEEINKLFCAMEPRKKALEEAQRSTSATASGIIASKKAHLTDNLLPTVIALREAVGEMESRIKALMEKNEELEAVLRTKE